MKEVFELNQQLLAASKDLPGEGDYRPLGDHGDDQSPDSNNPTSQPLTADDIKKIVRDMLTSTKEDVTDAQLC